MHFDFTYCLQPNIPVFVLNLNLPLYSVPVSPIYHSVPLYLSLVYFFSLCIYHLCFSELDFVFEQMSFV